MRSYWVDDVMAVGVPADVDVHDNEQLAKLLIGFHKAMMSMLWTQFPTEKRPAAIILDEPEWLITGDPDEVERFQPAHDCVTCRAGQDQALAFLSEYPERAIALANLHYNVVWSD